MDISPLVPLVGLILIIVNVLVGALGAVVEPRFMGVQLFLAGMTTILISVIDLLNPVGIGAAERLFLFIAGSINCSLGYYMVLLEIRKHGA